MSEATGRTGRQGTILAVVAMLLVSCSALTTATGPAPSATVPADTVPAGTVPAGTVPAGTVPAGTVPASTVPAATATAAAPRTERRASIVVGFAGDTSFTNGLDRGDPFGQVTELLAAPDLMVVNLETTLADDDVGRPPVPKPFLFRSPPASVGLLAAAGIDVVSLANNHTLDFGPDALEQTLRELDRAGVARVGAGVDEDEAYSPLVLEVGQWTVGLVALSRVPCDWSASGRNVRPQVAWACPALIERAETAVRAARARSDVTVVMVHGGEEGVFCPSDFMVELNRRWADLGVDAVINGHPHVLQGISSIGDTLVVGSTGNFAFPSARGVTADSGVFLLQISDDPVVPGSSTPRIDLRLVPLRVDGGVVTIPDGERAAAIRERVSSVSVGWRLDGEGRARQAPEHTGSC